MLACTRVGESHIVTSRFMAAISDRPSSTTLTNVGPAQMTTDKYRGAVVEVDLTIRHLYQ
jgi:hypothetical protein